MYKSFKVRNFRCFEELDVGPLAHINLVAGKNNVGKTALLEALWLHYGYYNPELPMMLNRFRGFNRVKREEFYQDIFNGFDRDKIIKLTSHDYNDETFSLQITVREQYTSHVSLSDRPAIGGNGDETLSSDVTGQETTSPVQTEVIFEAKGGIEAHAYVELDNIRFERPKEVKEPSAIFQSARTRENFQILASRFGDLEVIKRQTEIVEALSVVEPRLEDLTIRYEMDTPVIYGDIGTDRLMPLAYMGDGVGRLLQIVLAIPQARDGALLVDEIENGLHYSVMREVWEVVSNIATAYNVQVYATTHSYECVQAAYQALADKGQDEFALHRLERVEGKIEAVTYDREMLEAAFELDAEVR